MADGFNPGAAQGANQNGNPGNQSGNQGNPGGQGQAQGAESQFVSKADFDALTAKLDAVIGDNAKLRQERRQGRQSSDNDGNQSGQSGNSASGSDAATSELATIRTQLRTANFRNDITAAATRHNAIIPTELYKLLSPEDAGADDLGYVANADKAVTDLKKKYPQLFGEIVQGGANGGSGSGQRNTDPNDMNALLRRDLRGRRGLSN